MSQTVASLSDLGTSPGGIVTTSVGGLATLIVSPTGGSTTFSGTIQDGSGQVALVMSGNGTQVLTGNSNYSGGTTVQSGLLSVSNDYNLGSPIGALTLTGGTFQASTGFTLSATRPVSVGAATVDVPNGTLIFAGTIADAGATPGTLTKTGTGVLQLDGNSTYSGATAINVGTLAGTGTLASTVTVNSGAFIAPGDNTSGNFGVAGTMTLGGLTLNTGSQVDLDLGTGGNDLLAVNGLLTLNGATVDIQANGTLTGGVYEVMSYQGTLGGSVSTLLAGTLPVGFSGIFVNNTALDQIDLELFGATKVWTGSNGPNGSAWDIETTPNWSLSLAATTYSDGDAVLFNDTAVTGNVTVAGTVAPAVFVVNNSTLPYTFSGDGNIAGGVSLIKQGTGMLAMNMANNTYTGGTNLGGGVLQIGASSTVSGGTLVAGPLGTGPLNISGGTLQDGGAGYTLANAVDITGNVTLASAGADGLTFGSGLLPTPNTMTISGCADHLRHRADDHRRHDHGPLGQGRPQHPEPHRGGEHSQRHHAGQRRHPGGHGGQPGRGAGHSGQRRQRDLRPAYQ